MEVQRSRVGLLSGGHNRKAGGQEERGDRQAPQTPSNCTRTGKLAVVREVSRLETGRVLVSGTPETTEIDIR